MHIPESHTQRFSEAFGFIIAGARASAAYVAPVVFVGRDVGVVGIAVNFTGGEKQQAFGRMQSGMVEQPAQAPDVGIHCFDRMLAVKDRRGDRCGMDNKIGGGISLAADDVGGYQLKIGAGFQLAQPFRHTAQVIVQSDKPAGTGK